MLTNWQICIITMKKAKIHGLSVTQVFIFGSAYNLKNFWALSTFSRRKITAHLASTVIIYRLVRREWLVIIFASAYYPNNGNTAQASLFPYSCFWVTMQACVWMRVLCTSAGGCCSFTECIWRGELLCTHCNRDDEVETDQLDWSLDGSRVRAFLLLEDQLGASLSYWYTGFPLLNISICPYEHYSLFCFLNLEICM